jgi:hypothetical protein
MAQCLLCGLVEKGREGKGKQASIDGRASEPAWIITTVEHRRSWHSTLDQRWTQGTWRDLDELFPQSAGPIWNTHTLVQSASTSQNMAVISSVPNISTHILAAWCNSRTRPPIILRGLGWKDAAYTVRAWWKKMRRSLAEGPCLTIANKTAIINSS